MAAFNSNYQKLPKSYLFAEVEKRAKEKKDVADLGRGDISLPLIPEAAKAITLAVLEMTEKVIGYGPYFGYSFLRKAIKENDYKDLPIDEEEIFISSGIKSDIAYIRLLFAKSALAAICEPCYPVYQGSNLLFGKNILFLPLKEEGGFAPKLPFNADLIYLCSPNNPTGTSLSFETLKAFVSFAKKENAVILFDGAYTAFMQSDNPRSIYEIEGADEVSVEFRSFSKSAGFTGLRCGYTVIPKKMKKLFTLWQLHLQNTMSGIPYPIQKGAEALYSPLGKSELKEQIAIYHKNTSLLHDGLKKLGLTLFGGIDTPYIWCKVPNSLTFFETLLEKGVVCIPGRGFGPHGEGFVRFSALAKEEIILTALERLKTL